MQPPLRIRDDQGNGCRLQTRAGTAGGSDAVTGTPSDEVTESGNVSNTRSSTAFLIAMMMSIQAFLGAALVAAGQTVSVAGTNSLTG